MYMYEYICLYFLYLLSKYYLLSVFHNRYCLFSSKLLPLLFVFTNLMPLTPFVWQWHLSFLQANKIDWLIVPFVHWDMNNNYHILPYDDDTNPQNNMSIYLSYCITCVVLVFFFGDITIRLELSAWTQWRTRETTRHDNLLEQYKCSPNDNFGKIWQVNNPLRNDNHKYVITEMNFVENVITITSTTWNRINRQPLFSIRFLFLAWTSGLAVFSFHFINYCWMVVEVYSSSSFFPQFKRNHSSCTQRNLKGMGSNL